MGTKITDLMKRGRVTITASSSGATSLVGAITGAKIIVTSFFMTSNGTVNVKFQSGATDVTGLLYEVANTGISSPYNDEGWFETTAGAALNINLSGNVAVGGVLNYVIVN